MPSTILVKIAYLGNKSLKKITNMLWNNTRVLRNSRCSLERVFTLNFYKMTYFETLLIFGCRPLNFYEGATCTMSTFSILRHVTVNAPWIEITAKFLVKQMDNWLQMGRQKTVKRHLSPSNLNRGPNFCPKTFLYDFLTTLIQLCKFTKIPRFVHLEITDKDYEL